MANLGSIAALTADANTKVTSNGSQQNTGLRVNQLINNMIDTLTGSPVVGTNIFASAAQGALAASALQAGDNVSDLVNDAGYITSSSEVLTGNMAYVDAVNGDDGTGAVGDFSLPFLTLFAAMVAAPSGTTIVVRPGTYTSVGLGKDGVNWFFFPGSSITFTGVGWTLPVSGPTQQFSVFGYGEFSASASAVISIATPSNVSISCQSISGNTITVADGNTIINCGVISIEQGMTLSAGVHIISANTITPGTSISGLAISGTAIVTINGLLTSASSVETLNISGAGAFFTLNGSVEAESGSTMTHVFDMSGGNVIINGNIYHRGVGHGITQSSGTLTVNNGYIKTTSASTNAIQKTTSFGSTRLNSVSLESTTTSIVATTTAFIRCAGVYSTLGLGPGAGVTISGSYHIYDNSITAGEVATANADGTWGWA